MEPASGEMGMCWVRDDKSQPNSPAESTGTHLHLIHQPLSPPTTWAKGTALKEPLWAPRSAGIGGWWQGDLSCQKAGRGPSGKGEPSKWIWVRPKAEHSLVQNFQSWLQ